jgi:hypothetical protein
MDKTLIMYLRSMGICDIRIYTIEIMGFETFDLLLTSWILARM